MKPQPAHRSARILTLAAAAIASTILATGPEGPSASAAADPVRTRAAAPPDIRLVGSPTLFVTTRSRVGQDESVAWVVFTTSRHLHVPQQVVARAHDRSGRSFGDGGNCIRSTIVSDEAGAPGFTRGATYRVQLFARASIRAAQRRRFFSRQLVAHGSEGPPPRSRSCARM